MKKIKSTISRNLTNARGWRTDRKIIVFESDDWGSIRMPGKEIYNELRKSPLGKSLNLFDSLDSLERRDDFINLLEIANKFKDFKSNPLIFTLNVVMQNPDFKKIRESGFSKFYGIPFLQSYKDYYGETLEDLWRNGIANKLIKPQFHAREHLNEFLWLKDLREGHQDVKIGFDYGFFGTRTTTSSKLRKHYLATYFSETLDEYECVTKNCMEGINMFRSVFGYSSKSFIASNYTWPSELEEVLSKSGIKTIQGQFGNIITDFTKGITKVRRHFTGKQNSNNQIFTTRNVIFEPSMKPKKDWVTSAMKEIENAFFWKKPAIICMHRVNFSSEMSIKNRDKNLVLLESLIINLLKKYPELEFLDSEELGKLITYDQKC